MQRGFGTEVDCGQVSKTDPPVSPAQNAAGRYSPAEVVRAEKTIVSGAPDVNRLCASQVEKQNHAPQMHCRRLTRLHNAFSKKCDHFQAAIALNLRYYNFVKSHGAICLTPAQAAGLKIARGRSRKLVERCGE
jgi:hypothetical protein